MYVLNIYKSLKTILLSLALIIASCGYLHAQDLLTFIENCANCKNCSGKVKKITTKQKADINDYRSPMIYKIEEFNTNEQLVKKEIKFESRISKTVSYHYIDSLLIYELHKSPNEEDYYLVYQYYQKELPTKVIKVDKKRRIINYAEVLYTENKQPVYLKFYNVLGKLLEKRSVEFQSKNQVVIRSFIPDTKFENLQRFELLCKFNEPNKLKKRDFRDIVTRPINLEREDNTLRVVKAVQVDKKEKVQIEEIAYDEQGNWLNKKTFELKNNRNKKRLVKEIEREIEYY